MMNGKKTEPEEPLSRESEPLYRQAAEILRDRILKGEYPPGTMIPSERELGNSLGISRIPIRDAIKSLQYIGIVNQVKGKGVVVQKLDPGQVLGICQDTSKKLVRSLFIPEEPQQGLCPYASLPQDIFLT